MNARWMTMAAAVWVAAAAATETPLSSLDMQAVRQGWGKPERNRAVTSNAMAIAGAAFTNGVGTHAPSIIPVQLDGRATRFRARCGVDDHAGNDRASVRFLVVGDGRMLWDGGTMKWKQKAAEVDLEVSGVNSLLLVATDAGDGKDFDHANWADAVVVHAGEPPRVTAPPPEKAEILTPPPPPAPRINGPRVFGARPGHPFLYRIPCTGERPMRFAVEGLPKGLALDAKTGIITGTTPARGEHAMTLRAENARGKASRPFRLVAGDTLALTPTMGYNHWYTHYNRITQELMQQAADILVSSGMADAGYMYVSVDDCWMNAPATGKYQTDPKRVGPLRDEKGMIIANGYFPDMKAMADYIHSKGLRAGLYTSPGPLTCAGFGGAYEHEEQDARQFAAWGYDLLKYDWCSYGRIAGKSPDLAALQKPYRLMGDLLRRQNRDLVLNLCQYGMGEVWKWGAEVGGHSWRTGGDLGFELDRIFEIALKNVGLREYNRPGAWNDPDYLQIGWIGNARGMGDPKPCPLSPNEQYSFMALWCLMASPLFYSGDVTHLDEFVLNILCNAELIDLNQDPLGTCARLVGPAGEGFVLVKELEDGGAAVGLCNRALWPQRMRVAWADAGRTGPQRVRDCWRQKDLGAFDTAFEAEVPPRMVTVLRLESAGNRK